MNRNEATKTLRHTLDQNGLSNWSIRIDINSKNFLGLCDYKEKCVILSGHHIDQHGEVEVLNTIRHEVAHALVGAQHGHDNVWAAKARELGCDNTLPCASYNFNEEIIDAIRSGAKVEVTYEEHVIRKPVHKITKLQEYCPVKSCGKVAKEKSRNEANGIILIFLECGHIAVKQSGSKSKFEELTFDGDPNCKHQWGTAKGRKTICVKCNAKKLYPYQIEGARELEKANGRKAIFDEMGLGKTIQALAYLKYNLESSTPYLWITRSGIKFQHFKEIVRVLGPENCPYPILRGKDSFIRGFKGYICGYDLLRKLDLNQIKEVGIKTIVLDECQAIKNPDSSRTKAIREIVETVPKIIPLSGTPWKNRGSELFVVLNILDPMMFYSFKSFKERYVDIITGPDGKEREAGIRNPEKFREQIKHIAIRRERKEVMPELPLVNRTKLFCEIPDHARKVYEEQENILAEMLKDVAIEGHQTFAQASAINDSIMTMRQIVGLAKVDSIVDFVSNFLEETEPNRKYCVFIHHKEVGKQVYEKLYSYCKENGHPLPLQLTADLDGAERFEVQNKFNSDKYRLLIGSTLASGEGLNLQTCSDAMIAERQWNPANEEQAEGRFVRIGSEAQSVNITYALAEDSVDMDLDGIVETKRIAFHNTMNVSQFIGWSENDIKKEMLDKILEKVRKRKNRIA